MEPVPSKTQKVAGRVGAIVQGLILGALLLAAAIELKSTSVSVNLFRYQGF